MAMHARLVHLKRWAALGALFYAAAGAAAVLPPERRQGEVAFLSGGVGEDEAAAMRESTPQYPLALQFVARSGEDAGAYLADVEVSIRDSRGNWVLQTMSPGPILLARLPQGNYTVTAVNEGVTKSQRVHVPAKGTKRVVFGW